MIEFKAKIKISNGKLISQANIENIFAVKQTPLQKHLHVTGVPEIDNAKTYYETFKIVKEPQGYIFREVLHKGGINGFHPTLRSLIMQTVGHYQIKIFCKQQ